MTKTNKIALGIAIIAIAAVGIHQYKKRKALPKTASGTGTKSAAPSRYVVGGYDAANDRTYIFQEGNTGNGFFVTGSVSSRKGTIFNLA